MVRPNEVARRCNHYRFELNQRHCFDMKAENIAFAIIHLGFLIPDRAH